MAHAPNKYKSDRLEAGLPIYDPLRQVRTPAGPIPTIRQLMRGHGGWCWAYCLGGPARGDCYYERPIAFAQFAIRWDLDASSDLIRERLVCSQCGHKGVQIIMPSRDGTGAGMSFPAEWVNPTHRIPARMCNLYSQTKGQQAIREITRALHDRTGNLPSPPSIFPDRIAPIVRIPPRVVN